MKIIGYVDGTRRFVRDDVTVDDCNRIAESLQELADYMKLRVALVVECDGIAHLMHAWRLS